MAETLACWACGRVVADRIIEGLAGLLGPCPCSDRDGAPVKLRPLGPLEQVTAGRERRAAAAAYRRGKLKSQTPEGRAKLTAREVAELARREPGP